MFAELFRAQKITFEKIKNYHTIFTHHNHNADQPQREQRKDFLLYSARWSFERIGRAEDFHTLPQNETELRIVGKYSFSDLKIDITEESVDS